MFDLIRLLVRRDWMMRMSCNARHTSTVIVTYSDTTGKHLEK